MMELGEAARRLSRLGVLAPHGVEWASAVANRNAMIDQYDEINRELTWLTPLRDLPGWRSYWFLPPGGRDDDGKREPD